jgi:hypothetical protein
MECRGVPPPAGEDAHRLSSGRHGSRIEAIARTAPPTFSRKQQRAKGCEAAEMQKQSHRDHTNSRAEWSYPWSYPVSVEGEEFGVKGCKLCDLS